jgi:hypothetical protein
MTEAGAAASFEFRPGAGGFPDRLKLGLAFDAARLAEDLGRLAGIDWTRHYVEQHFSGDWSVIPLRGPAGAVHPILQIFPSPAVTAFADLPALALTPYVRQVLAAFACPLQCVRLMRLAPGSRIETHTDYDLAFEQGVARIHVPITTNPGVDFRLNDVPVVMAAGEAWYLRLSDLHSVDNRGATDRVHLVIDAEANAWLRDQLVASTARPLRIPGQPRPRP